VTGGELHQGINLVGVRADAPSPGAYLLQRVLPALPHRHKHGGRHDDAAANAVLAMHQHLAAGSDLLAHPGRPGQQVFLRGRAPVDGG